MRSNALVLLGVVGLFACDKDSEQNEHRTTDVAAVRRAIDSTNANMQRWYAAGQADSVATTFARDARQMPPNSPALVGRDSIRAFWAASLPLGQWKFELATDEVVASDTIAVERGHYVLHFAAGPKAPMPSFEDRGNYVVLWHKESDGKWRAVWDAPVSELPPPGAPSNSSKAPTAAKK